MKKFLAVPAAVAAVGLAVPAIAGAQSISVYNAGGIPSWRVSQFERAAGAVANSNLRWQWNSPGISWTNRRWGWPLLLTRNPNTVAQVCGAAAAGCHGVLPTGQPAAILDTNQADTGVPWTVTASHELFEMLVNPWTSRQIYSSDGSGDAWAQEVADPVEDYSQWLGGVQLTDFVYPAWFQNASGPQDAMGWLDDSYAGTGTYEISCPTGYAQYSDPYLGNQTLSCSSSSMHRRNGRALIRKGRHSHRLLRFHRGPLRLNLGSLTAWRG